VISRTEVAGLIDHTLLKPEATAADVAALVAEAVELGTFAVCVSASMVPVAAAARPGDTPLIAAVAGFPSGKHLTAIKADEAARAVAAGAAEIDMVIDVGAALAGEFDAVRADVSSVRAAVREATLKVIVESAALLSLPGGGSTTLIAACRAAEDAGADFVKTSTGFHPSGGASVTAVELMAGGVGLGVKASGGIRTAADALAMINAGATRLGLSSTRAVLDGLPDGL
jgi:deoxyribose-phosphate aldolase